MLLSNKKIDIMIKRKQFRFYLLALMAIALVISCTDLEIEETDSVLLETGDEGFSGVADVSSAIDQVYNSYNGYTGDQANWYALNEVSTDELLVPTRGTDWGDNGIWRTLHTHTWDAAHSHILNVWNNFNQEVFRVSQAIDSRSNPTPDEVAEGKFLRAYAMFNVMDLYGQVPFREVDEGPEIDPKVMTRIEALAFVVQDLRDAIAGLPSVSPGGETNRASKATAKFLLAKVLLNAHIYNGSGSADSGDMAEVISLVDEISANGYALESGYFDIFKEDVDNETVWWLPIDVGNRIWNGMHYNIVAPDNTGGGWNGFTTLAEFYDLFEGDANSNTVGSGQEERRGFVPDASNAGPENLGIGYGFLIGQQYDADGVALKDRPGNPLVFTKELPGLVGNNERTGVRVIKYHPVNGSFTSHELVFRYADAHLMKAEAMMRSGGDATTLVNELRVLRGATPLGSVSESDLIDERGRELYGEFWRRNDLVRFGQFTKDWEFKNVESVGDETKNLYPIPSNALLSNPNLTQNPGY